MPEYGSKYPAARRDWNKGGADENRPPVTAIVLHPYTEKVPGIGPAGEDEKKQSKVVSYPPVEDEASERNRRTARDKGIDMDAGTQFAGMTGRKPSSGRNVKWDE